MTSWRWQGPVVAIANGEKYFRGIAGHSDAEKDAVSYAVGDCVLLMRDNAVGSDIVHIMAMWEARDGGKFAEVRYYCNASAVNQSRKASSASADKTSTPNELYESDRIAEVDIAKTFARKMSVGTKTKSAQTDFIATGMYHIKTNRIVPLKSNVSCMQRSRTIGFRAQMIPVSNISSFPLPLAIHDDEEDDTGVDPSDRRKRQRVDSDEASSLAAHKGSAASPVLCIDPLTLRKLQKACEELQLSSLPKVMTGRENERTEIYSTLKSSIHAGSAGGAIYISGLPGTGKTSIVKEIIQSLEAEKKRGDLPHFVWIEVNGLTMPKPDVAYSVIWKALQEGETMLQHEFEVSDDERPVLLILLDEMDFMVAGKNQVLYNLLEWQTLASSKLVLIGIANTMDLPERLPGKIRSRLGVHRITFPAYTSVQLEQIIEQRLAQLDVFSKEAIQVCAKSLAHQSGDVRQALTVCRKAVEVCIRRLSHDEAGSSSQNGNANMHVTVQDLQHAQQAISVSAPMSRLRACSKFECIFIVALLMEVKTKEKQEGEFEDVINRFAILCKTHSFSPIPRLRGFTWICDELERSGLIRQIRSKSSRYPRLELRCSNQEIHEVFLTHSIGMQLIS
ncbi:Origin recognition complex subunit, partial [Globisporangium splendens]